MKQETGWSPEEDIEHSDASPAHAPMEDAGEDDANRSTVEVIQTLFENGKDYARFEMERQKLRMEIMASGFRFAATFGIVALFLLFGLLVALPIGAIWILSPYVGPLVATLIVLLVGIAVIALLAAMIRSKLRKTIRIAMQKEATNGQP